MSTWRCANGYAASLQIEHNIETLRTAHVQHMMSSVEDEDLVTVRGLEPRLALSHGSYTVGGVQEKVDRKQPVV